MKEFKNEAQNKINHQQQANKHTQCFCCTTEIRLYNMAQAEWKGESHVLAASSRKNFVITQEELRGAPTQKELSDKNN